MSAKVVVVPEFHPYILVNSGYSSGKTTPPDPKNHFRISMLKSGLRMVGYVVLVLDLRIGVGLLLISEFIGILEELV